jgi:hypothetical protein
VSAAQERAIALIKAEAERDEHQRVRGLLFRNLERCQAERDEAWALARELAEALRGATAAKNRAALRRIEAAIACYDEKAGA